MAARTYTREKEVLVIAGILKDLEAYRQSGGRDYGSWKGLMDRMRMYPAIFFRREKETERREIIWQ